MSTKRVPIRLSASTARRRLRGIIEIRGLIEKHTPEAVRTKNHGGWSYGPQTKASQEARKPYVKALTFLNKWIADQQDIIKACDSKAGTFTIVDEPEDYDEDDDLDDY